MNHTRKFIKQTEGAAAIIIACSLVALIGVASLAIDMGQLYTVRNQLQNVADAAALAGAGQLINPDGTRNSTQANQAAITVAQKQSGLDGLAAVGDGDRNDLTILFGTWDIYKGDPSTAWTAQTTVDSTTNAMQVTLKRNGETVFGPVTSLFAQVLGYSTTSISASATAYLGYSSSVAAGTVAVPLALPATVLAGMQTERGSWFARLFAPRAAQATANSLTFKDLGGSTFYQSDKSKPYYDATKAYLFRVKTGDDAYNTVLSNITRNSSTGTAVRSMAVGTVLYPISEYYWASNNKSIFNALKLGYTAKKDGNNNWRILAPVYSTTNPLARHRSDFLWRLARNLLPGVTEAQACFTFPRTDYTSGGTIYVSGFANIDITNVNYDSACKTDSGDGQVTNVNSCRNTNYVSVSIPTGVDTVSPGGSTGNGGIVRDNKAITGGTQAGGPLVPSAVLTK
jgi:Flp pilus assembly protein TadG